jgi:hypothetical protein
MFHVKHPSVKTIGAPVRIHAKLTTADRNPIYQCRSG